MVYIYRVSFTIPLYFFNQVFGYDRRHIVYRLLLAGVMVFWEIAASKKIINDDILYVCRNTVLICNIFSSDNRKHLQ